MAIHIATAEEIDGALDDSEILVLHLEGPRKGMILANKKNDATVAAAIAAGEVIQVETPVKSGPPSVSGQLHGQIRAFPHGNLVNPPAAYPAQVTMLMSGTTIGDVAPKVAQVYVNGALQSDNAKITDYGGGSWDVPVDVAAAGPLDVVVVFDTGDVTQASIDMKPAVAPLPPVESTVTLKAYSPSGTTYYVLDLDDGKPKVDFANSAKHTIRIVHDTGKTDADYATLLNEDVGTICVAIQNNIVVMDATPTVNVKVSEILPWIAAGTVLEAFNDSAGLRLTVKP